MNKLIAYFFCSCSLFCSSQNSTGFVWPIDTPRILVGNYGELRANHFHAGWDFSTRGKINLPVYAIADGYVSRIKISAAGYGKALYITHANGKVSVYAHLTSYAEPLAAFIRKEQYARKSYEIELFPAKDEFKVSKGSIIARSGNSGNSSGPHLHFEVRDERSEIPLNAARFFNLSDTVKPVPVHLALYNLADTIKPLFMKDLKVKANKRDSFFIQEDSLVLDQSILGFAFSGFDQFVAKGNANVIYSARLFLDERQIFGYAMNEIAFDEQRFVNEFAEAGSIKYQKCFLPALYPAGLYGSCVNKGRIILTDTNYHVLKLLLNDESENERSIQFYIKTKKINAYATLPPADKNFIDCNKNFSLNQNGLQLFVPAKTLYNASFISLESNNLKASATISIMPAYLNLRSPARLAFTAPGAWLAHKNKIVLRQSHSVYCPLVKGDSLFYNISSFGSFQLKVDTLAPKLKTELTLKKIKRLKKINSFSFVMRDEMSGVGKYGLFVNGDWVLAEYDAKTSLLTYFFDEHTPPGALAFMLEAEDKAGNRTEFKFTLKR